MNWYELKVTYLDPGKISKLELLNAQRSEDAEARETRQTQKLSSLSYRKCVFFNATENSLHCPEAPKHANKTTMVRRYARNISHSAMNWLLPLASSNLWINLRAMKFLTKEYFGHDQIMFN